MDIQWTVIARLLEALFLIGVAGCLITIPLVAWKMFSVLFERDTDPAEE